MLAHSPHEWSNSEMLSLIAAMSQPVPLCPSKYLQGGREVQVHRHAQYLSAQISQHPTVQVGCLLMHYREGVVKRPVTTGAVKYKQVAHPKRQEPW
jgi:hypothetical protein